MILSQMILPTELDPAKKALYVRGDAVCGDGLVLRRGDIAAFDTYFNGFFYGPYLRYTNTREVRLCVSTTGCACLTLLCLDSAGQEHVLAKVNADGQESKTIFPSYELAALPKDGALYLRMEALDEAVLHAGWFETDVERETEVHLAAVICTFRREDYVYRNLKEIQKGIWNNSSCPVKDDMDVFVVDNGQTIQLDKHEHIQVFPNKNYGGSGGFTRGLLEAYRRRECYTHVLFMDDDISFEPEVLVRTIQFLKLARPSEQPICIGGQMLIQDEPTVQFESGANYVDGRLVANNRGLELSDRRALLLNMQQREIGYNAWWYCCFPVSVVERHGLPLPLFIKTDDVEYGLRIKPQIVLLNGIGVWHMAFQSKYSTHLEYYIKRNELLVSAVHDCGAGFIPSAWKMIRACARSILIGNPQNVDYILWAYRDFLKGPDFFLATDEEQLNTQLIQAKRRPIKNRLWSILSDPFRLLPVLFHLTTHYSIVRTAYVKQLPELTSLEFWSSHLGITGKETN